MVFIPIQDDNQLRSIRFQWVTLGLIAVNVAVFVATIAGIPETVLLSFAIVPRELVDEGWRGFATYPHKYNFINVAERWTLLTYMFMHGNIMHLIGNMLFLWVFGDNVEDAMGHARYLAFYVLCGVFAAVFHSWLQPTSEIPLIGASGAVAGIIAAYLMLTPKVRVWVLVFRLLPLRLPAYVVLGSWIAIQFAMPLLGQSGLLGQAGQAGEVSWWAHVGGIIAGAVLVLVMRRPGVPLFRGVGSR